LATCCPGCDSGCNPDAVPKSYPSVGLMRVDRGARLGLGITQRDWPRSGILADVMGVGVDHRVAPGGWWSGVCMRLVLLPSPTAGLPYDIQPNLRNCNDCRSEQRQEDFPFVAPARALCGPPCRDASTNHTEDGIEHRYDRPSIANLARCALGARGGVRWLRKFLVGRGASAGEQGDHTVRERIERGAFRLECLCALLCPHPSSYGPKKGIWNRRRRRTRRFR